MENVSMDKNQNDSLEETQLSMTPRGR
jgi:hypothetical protein